MTYSLSTGLFSGSVNPLANTPHSETRRETLEDAYRRYRLELRRFFALNSRDPHAVDDLIQSMYLSVKKTRPAAEVRDPRQYVFRIAWNLLHTENRRLQAERSQNVSCEPAELDAYAERSNRLWVEDDTSAQVEHGELERVLAQLPRACRVALLRQIRDNRSYNEIAAELGVTPHAVKKYIMRALNHFRMYFNSTELGAQTQRKRR